MDAKRVAYIEGVCSQIREVSQTIGQTIKDIGYVGKYQALPPPRIIPYVSYEDRQRGLREVYSADESVRSLVDQLSATQHRVEVLENELLSARLALAERNADRVNPSPSQQTLDHTMHAKLRHMQDELNTMLNATNEAMKSNNNTY